MTAKFHVIKGHWQDESGLLEPGELMVEFVDGKFYDPDGSGALTATTYAITKDMTGVEIKARYAVWTFIPDGGECERIGMPVVNS